MQTAEQEYINNNHHTKSHSYVLQVHSVQFQDLFSNNASFLKVSLVTSGTKTIAHALDEESLTMRRRTDTNQQPARVSSTSGIGNISYHHHGLVVVPTSDGAKYIYFRNYSHPTSLECISRL